MSEPAEPMDPVRSAWHFARHVLERFLANKGLLLASAVSYNTLLSLIPCSHCCWSFSPTCTTSKG